MKLRHLFTDEALLDWLVFLTVAVLLGLVTCGAARSAPPQAPRPPQAPPVAQEAVSHHAAHATKSCGCSQRCTCGCQEGGPCTCGEASAARASSAAPVHHSPPAAVSGAPAAPPAFGYFAPQPAYLTPAPFQAFRGGSRRGGGC